jgi:hypothetical protein
MNLKRVFGAILTLLGIAGLIFTGVGIINHNSGYTIIFFFTGISLVRTTQDDAK